MCVRACMHACVCVSQCVCVCVCACVCVLGVGWGLGGMELRVGSNNDSFFAGIIYTAASHTAHVLYIFCVYIYICIVNSYIICITFMNIITFDYFVFT